MLISSGPHQTNIGNREFRQMPTATRRLCGHCSIGPSGVRDQSISRTRAAISPPRAPARSAAAAGAAGASLLVVTYDGGGGSGTSKWAKQCRESIRREVVSLPRETIGTERIGSGLRGPPHATVVSRWITEFSTA